MVRGERAVAAGLLDHLARDGRAYERVLFWAFRYAPTWFGLPLVADRAVLIPTAEDDDLIRTSPLVGDFFARPRATGFLTPEERDLVASPVRGRCRRRRSSARASIRPPARVARHGAREPGRRRRLRALSGTRRQEQGLRSALRARGRTRGGDATASPTLVLAGPVVPCRRPHPRIRALGLRRRRRRARRCWRTRWRWSCRRRTRA